MKYENFAGDKNISDSRNSSSLLKGKILSFRKKQQTRRRRHTLQQRRSSGLCERRRKSDEKQTVSQKLDSSTKQRKHLKNACLCSPAYHLSESHKRQMVTKRNCNRFRFNGGYFSTALHSTVLHRMGWRLFISTAAL